MEISVYKHEETQQLLEDLKYWSNAVGELHHYGEYSIKEKELPHELMRAYHELWKEGAGGSYCYLAEYMGEYGIALINEFDKEYCKEYRILMNAAFTQMKERAQEYSELPLFKDVKIILGEKSGVFEGHEFVTFIPWNTPKERFNKICDVLFKTVYASGKVSDILKEFEDEVQEDELRVTGLFYMKMLPGETKEEAENRFLNAIYKAGLDVCNATLQYELESEVAENETKSFPKL